MDIGKKISERRKELGLTLEQVGTYVGVGKSTVKKWETGYIANMKRDKIALLAKVLKMNPTEFIDGYEDDSIEDSEQSNISEIHTENIYNVPVFNSVSAGFGAYASDFIEGYIPTYLANKAEASEYIWINVKGDSMHPRIMDGDRILVRRQTSVDSGSIAVLLLDGEEGLVKKVEYGPDWIDLISFNPEYPVKHFKGADVQRLQVVGLVKEVSRKL